MDKILFFDTETTGVPRNYQAPVSDTSNWPRLVQLGWIVANVDGSIISKSSYIICPDGFNIPIAASNIHGITTDYARREGRNIADVLALFVQDLGKVNRIVGHNVDFDQHIVGAELYRLNWSYSQLFNLPMTCTMKSSIDFCKLPPLRFGEYKWPKLEELYTKLFGTTFSGAHDAMADIEATKKCYFELIRREIITDYQYIEPEREIIIMKQSKNIKSGKCGDNVNYELTEDGVLTIFGEGKMWNYDCECDVEWGLQGCSSPFYKGENIVKVIVCNGITSIGDYAFFYCTSLKSIEIPNSVTSIGELAFNNCTSLKSIEVPNGVTVIENGVFCVCTSLKSIKIPDSVTSIGDDAFSNCISLESIKIPNSVTSIGLAAFCNCTSLVSIKMPNSVMSIGSSAFSNCTSLESIEIPNGVTIINYGVFSNCTSLKSIKIPNSVTYIEYYAFNDTAWYNNQPNGFIYINDKFLYKYKGRVPEDTHIKVQEGIIQICGEAFGDCTSLKSIKIPNSVVSIGDRAFSGCTSLVSIKIPNSVTSIEDGTFHKCISLISIEIPNSVTSIGYNAFSDCTSLVSIKIPNSVTVINYGAFSDCTSLKSIEIPNSVTSIGGSVFSGCTSLKSIEIPNSVSEIGKAVFYGCCALTSIVLSDNIVSLESDKYEDADYFFYVYRGFFENCTSLVSMVIPNNVTVIGDYAFSGCTSLVSIIIPNSVTSIGAYTFSKCTSLAFIVCLSEKIESKNYVYLPDGCIVKVPKGTMQTYIEDWGVKEQNIEEFELASGECRENISYELKDNGTLFVLGYGSIENDAFKNDNRIKKAIIKEGVTTIGENAFKDCRKLRIVEIESPLEEIADGAFAGCENVISIIVKNDLPPIVGSNTFEGVESSVEIVVPESAMRYYKAAKGWNKFTNYVAIDLC